MIEVEGYFQESEKRESFPGGVGTEPVVTYYPCNWWQLRVTAAPGVNATVRNWEGGHSGSREANLAEAKGMLAEAYDRVFHTQPDPEDFEISMVSELWARV